jgi:hypothetical protein
MATYQISLFRPVFARYIPKTLLISNCINIINNYSAILKKIQVHG